MSSAANIVETMKRAQYGTGGSVPVVFIWGTYDVAAGETGALTDLKGDAIILDFDGVALFAVGIVDTRSGAGGSTDLYIAGTKVFDDLTASTADSLQIGSTRDSSEADFSAGAAVTVGANTRDFVGAVLLACLPT